MDFRRGGRHGSWRAKPFGVLGCTRIRDMSRPGHPGVRAINARNRFALAVRSGRCWCNRCGHLSVMEPHRHLAREIHGPREFHGQCGGRDKGARRDMLKDRSSRPGFRRCSARLRVRPTLRHARYRARAHSPGSGPIRPCDGHSRAGQCRCRDDCPRTVHEGCFRAAKTRNVPIRNGHRVDVAGCGRLSRPASRQQQCEPHCQHRLTTGRPRRGTSGRFFESAKSRQARYGGNSSLPAAGLASSDMRIGSLGAAPGRSAAAIRGLFPLSARGCAFAESGCAARDDAAKPAQSSDRRGESVSFSGIGCASGTLHVRVTWAMRILATFAGITARARGCPDADPPPEDLGKGADDGSLARVSCRGRAVNRAPHGIGRFAGE